MQKCSNGRKKNNKFDKHPGRTAIEDMVVVGGLVFVFALLGIWTRPNGLLAAFWPANAVLLALFVRDSRRTSVAGIAAAIGGYVAADMLTGGTWRYSLLLTFGNFAGITTAYLLFTTRAGLEHRDLRHPKSVLYMALVACVASIAAGFAGAIINPVLFHGRSLDGFHYWFVAEFVNYLAVLPVALILPQWGPWRRDQRSKSSEAPRSIRPDASMDDSTSGSPLEQYLPLAVLFVGIVLTGLMDGPGTIAFVVPGLLWCALSYSIFSTAVSTLFASAWLLLAVSSGFLSFGLSNGALVYSSPSLESVRVGISLVALASLVVASATSARNELMHKLKHAAMYDQLTGVLNRKGLDELSLRLFEQLAHNRQVISALMLDIDYFKKINDTHGHAIGDLVLVGFAELAASCLRGSDILGRFGGEEFAVLLPNADTEVAHVVAQRICEKCAAKNFLLPDGSSLQVTVSAGVSRTCGQPLALEALLADADDALYRAKRNGRNQVQGPCPDAILVQE